MTTALNAENEPILAAEIREELGRLWPEPVICANVRDGHEALREFERRQPQVLVLDVKMPGLTGIEVARVIGRCAHVVFITAFDPCSRLKAMYGLTAGLPLHHHRPRGVVAQIDLPADAA